MAQPNNQEELINIDNYNLAQGVPPDEGNMIVTFLFDKLKEAIGNPMLRTQIEGQLQALQFPPHVDERAPERLPRRVSERGNSLSQREERREESPLQEEGQDEDPSYNELSKERPGGDTPMDCDSEDVAPRRRRVQQTPSTPRRKRTTILSLTQIQGEKMVIQEEGKTVSNTAIIFFLLSFTFIIR